MKSKRIIVAAAWLLAAIEKHDLDRDAHAYAGVALLSAGCYLAYRPLGFIIAGALLLYLGLFHSIVVARFTTTRRRS